ncbi:hypothetical protein [Streptomyces sp. NRRL S-118]|uniref:hypothetical protein n=1 Tax=Streptomyces sp. NRRL S-118 TaxID=1463881 RepID=UPI000694FB3D
MHSYPARRLPYELHGDGPRPPVRVGTDAFRTPAAPRDAAFAAFAGFGGTGLDSPFAGTGTTAVLRDATRGSAR